MLSLSFSMRLSFYILIIFLFATLALASEFSKGTELYNKGEFKSALDIWLPLAENGNTDAQHNIGQMYRNGKGVERDYTEAFKWFHMAAEKGNIYSQNNLGHLYSYGLGVPKNNIFAYLWYQIASLNGYKRANKNLVSLKSEMSLAEIQTAKKLLKNYTKFLFKRIIENDS